jgi:hypothetical protein
MTDMSRFYVIGGREDQFIYQVVKVPVKGYLTLNGTRLIVGSRYSQGDINNGRLRYIHDIVETTSSRYLFTDWSFRAIGFDDGLPAMGCTNCGLECLPEPEIPRSPDGVYTETIRIKIFPPPRIVRKRDIELFEGDQYCLTEEDLTIVNEEDGEVFFPQNQIAITTLREPELGNLTLTSFTADAVSSVCFNAGMTPGDTRWEFQACNPKNKCINNVIQIKVKPFPTPTIWKNGGVTISCDTVDNVFPITNNNWNAGNNYSTSDQILYTINTPQNGSFNRLTFTQAEIDAGLITFTRDNSGNYSFPLTGTICNQKGKCVNFTKTITTSQNPCPPPPECGTMTVRFLANTNNPSRTVVIDPRRESFALNYYLNISDCEHGTNCFEFSIDVNSNGLVLHEDRSDITWNKVISGSIRDNDICGAEGSIGQLIFGAGEQLCGSTVRITVNDTHPITSGDYIDLVFNCDNAPPVVPADPGEEDPGPQPPPPITPGSQYPDTRPTALQTSNQCVSIRFYRGMSTTPADGYMQINASNGTFNGNLNIKYYISSANCGSYGYDGPGFGINWEIIEGSGSIGENASPPGSRWNDDSSAKIYGNQGSIGQMSVNVNLNPTQDVVLISRADPPISRGDIIRISVLPQSQNTRDSNYVPPYNAPTEPENPPPEPESPPPDGNFGGMDTITPACQPGKLTFNGTEYTERAGIFPTYRENPNGRGNIPSISQVHGQDFNVRIDTSTVDICQIVCWVSQRGSREDMYGFHITAHPSHTQAMLGSSRTITVTSGSFGSVKMENHTATTFNWGVRFNLTVPESIAPGDYQINIGSLQSSTNLWTMYLTVRSGDLG